MRKWLTILFGLLIVGGSVIGFKKYMKSYELDVTMMNTIMPVRMIQANELITENMIQTVSVPTVKHMKDAIIKPELIIGKRAIVPIGETEEILDWKIGEDTLYPDNDEVYLGFKVSFVEAVNNMVRRGDQVDLWVEYTSPKIYTNTDEELSEEEQNYALSIDPNAAKNQKWKKVYNKQLISGLTVAYIKDIDGYEIVDDLNVSLPYINASQRDKVNMERFRQNSSGQPAYITFIINKDQYDKLAEGLKEGAIKLGLPSILGSIGEVVNSTLSEKGAVNE